MKLPSLKRIALPLLASILVVRLILALPNLTMPYWTEHEADFYTVTRFWLQEHRMPTEADYPNRSGVILQATQPPLFFLLSLPVVGLFDSTLPVPASSQAQTICYSWLNFNPPKAQLNDSLVYPTTLQSPATARFLLRLLDFVLSSAAVVVVFMAARKLVNDDWAALASAALLAFEPNMLNFTSIINNEAILILVVALNLYAGVRLLTRPRPHLGDLIWFALTIVLAILTRLNGWALAPGGLLMLIAVFRRTHVMHISRQVRIAILGVAGAVVLALVGIIIINLSTTGSIFGRYVDLETVLLSGLGNVQNLEQVTNVVHAVAEGSWKSYLEPVNSAQQPDLTDATTLATALVFFVALIGWVRHWRLLRQAGWLPLVIVLAALALVFARNSAALSVTTGGSTSLIYAPLRYYTPALPPLALLLGIGVTRFRGGLYAILFLCVCWMLALTLGRSDEQMKTTSPIVQADIMEQQASRTVENVLDPGFPRIVRYELDSTSEEGLLELRLYATTDTSLSSDYAIQIELAPDVNVLSTCQFLPANGAYPTQYWHPGAIVETTARIPNCGLPYAPGTEVYLRWRGADQTSQPVLLGQLDAGLPHHPSCPEPLGTIDGRLQIIRYTAPLTHQVGTLYLPAVNWFTIEPSSAVMRTYTLIHQDELAEYSCTSVPRLNTLPFDRWQPGETVYFDECPLAVPPNAPTGMYDVYVTVADAEGNVLAATDIQDNPIDGNRILVATVEFVP